MMSPLLASIAWSHVAGVRQIHHAVVDERRGLHAPLGHRPYPGESQLLHVVWRHLPQRAIALAIERTAPRQPLAVRWLSQQRVGHLRERRNFAIDEPDHTDARGAQDKLAMCVSPSRHHRSYANRQR